MRENKSTTEWEDLRLLEEAERFHYNIAVSRIIFSNERLISELERFVTESWHHQLLYNRNREFNTPTASDNHFMFKIINKNVE